MKKRSMLIAILVVLLIVSVAVIFYLLGSNNTKQNEKNDEEISAEENNQGSENNAIVGEGTSITPVSYSPKCSNYTIQQISLLADIDETKYNDISEYIQVQNDVKISLDYCESFETLEMKTYILTENEKNNVLSEIKDSTHSISIAGIGGVCVPNLKINYERNNNQYYVSFWGPFAMDSNDGNIYKILDKTVSNTLSNPQNCLYAFDNLSSTATSLIKNLSK